MYKCPECGETFDTPHEYEEKHGLDYGPYEQWSVCPYCGEPGYEEAVECDVCGETVCASEIHHVSSHGDMVEIKACDKCYDELEEDE